jgi:single-stranded-DNA-specific exonuclease
MKLIVRPPQPRAAHALEQAGVHPLLARLFAARGIANASDLDDGLANLIPPTELLGAQAAAELLAAAMARGDNICIVADYDCDGATACAVAVRGLRVLGATQVQYLVPDRLVDGYGLTPAIAERAKNQGAQLLITVDNGIASLEGVAHARALGLRVLVTDHHLPLAATPDGSIPLPDADVVVNPNQPGCVFASKSMAGVGVMFYVLLALRSHLRTTGVFDAERQPRLDHLLPLVALGTVADVVRLDANNRRLVGQGLRRIRSGHLPAGLRALFEVAGREPARATTFDFGFALGPRLNAAGRLSDMGLGIACLLTDDTTLAQTLAKQLDSINRERRTLEADMREQALLRAENLIKAASGQGLIGEGQIGAAAPAALSLHDPSFHEGVVGIVASRLKDHWHRPVFVFATAQDGSLKGSGRSIAGFHLRDALDLVAKRHPGLLLRFGGHAMAAGCSVPAGRMDEFAHALASVAADWLDAQTLQRRLETDGPLEAQYRRIDLVDTLHKEVWGQGFAPPVFSENFDVLSQRIVGQGHLALKLRHQGEAVDAMWFGRSEPLPARAKLAYRLDADSWNGQRRLRFLVEGMDDNSLVT